MNSQILKNNYNISNELIKDYAHVSNFSHDRRFEIALSGINEISNNIYNRSAIIVSIIDNTNAGGLHQIRILFDQINKHVFLEIPDGSSKIKLQSVKGGINPTVLHAVEIVVAVYKKLNIAYPKLNFGLASKNYLKTIKEKYGINICNKIVIPLTINPEYTNAIIFHTQIRRINPEKLALAWYEVCKQDPNTIKSPIRHTILLMPISNTKDHFNHNFEKDQPKIKRSINIAVFPKEVTENKTRFRTLHLSRISRWEEQVLNKNFLVPLIVNIGNKDSYTCVEI